MINLSLECPSSLCLSQSVTETLEDQRIPVCGCCLQNQRGRLSATQSESILLHPDNQNVLSPSYPHGSMGTNPTAELSETCQVNQSPIRGVVPAEHRGLDLGVKVERGPLHAWLLSFEVASKYERVFIPSPSLV